MGPIVRPLPLHAPRHRIGLASGVFKASRQTGGNAVSLHIPFVVIAASYAAGTALALAGHRRYPQHHLTPNAS
jgi:hypothetical protein